MTYEIGMNNHVFRYSTPQASCAVIHGTIDQPIIARDYRVNQDSQ
ncbi:hypothetical protein [Kosakonia arachidis]|nr:hypothetical protein [Kosakonia arachidis]